MPDTTHTPTPWGYALQEAGDEQYGGSGSTPFLITSICDLGWNLAAVIGDVPNLPAEANAAFIVRAVNAHDDLVAALKQCRDELVSIHHGDSDMEHAEKHSAGLRMANAALAAMEG